ncbi:MAG: hypothetical protein CVT88_00820 [Candidatus Altiarchaeales archaeon HGW-Altiarchaeales-1]|nr:MAG: hypothetical protein CVT88_00820 [Candidatus Altiarchaeales archaeon HGW-Altiarchaeales-1]
MASGKNLFGILGIVAAIVVSSFVIGLIFSTDVFSENTLNEWKTDTICSYNAKSNTTPEYSGCVKLSNVIMVYSSKNFVFVVTKESEFGGVSLYVVDVTDKNLTDNKFIYDKTPTQIVKYKNVISLTGNPTALCADGNLFAYGTSNYDFALFDGSTGTKLKGKNLGGKIASCDINEGNLAMCAGNNLYVIDEQGNVKWNKEVNGCKNVKILNNKVFAGTGDGFFVFSMEGTGIFSKNITIKDMAGTDKIAIASSDGIYIYDENSNSLNLLRSDSAVIGIAGLDKAIVYVTSSTLRAIKYNDSIIFEHVMKPGENLLSINGNKNYAVALTKDVKSPDTIIVEIIGGETVYVSTTTADDVASKVKMSYVKDGMWVSLFPDNAIGFKNFVGISANASIAKGENILTSLTNIGATDEKKKEINDSLNLMKDEYTKGNYEKVSEIARALKTKEIAMGNSYVLEEKSQTDNLLEMASEKGMILTSGTKLRYDNAMEEMFTGNYKSAISDFKGVRTETEQFVRDKVLVVLADVEQRKSAIEKFAESTKEITDLHEKINSEKDYVDAFTLLDDVKELEHLTKERTIELFENAEKAKKEAETPWIMFGADVRDIEDQIRTAHTAEDEKDYEKTIKTLSAATKQAKDYDVISKAQDVCVIAIVVGIIVLLILFIRRPKVKE